MSTNTTKLTVPFRNFTDTPKNINCHLELDELVRRANTQCNSNGSCIHSYNECKVCKGIWDICNKLQQCQGNNKSWTHTRGQTTQNNADCLIQKCIISDMPRSYCTLPGCSLCRNFQTWRCTFVSCVALTEKVNERRHPSVYIPYTSCTECTLLKRFCLWTPWPKPIYVNL